jgi:sulfur relay (sulfurtransferase) DsrC/TusE family protein
VYGDILEVFNNQRRKVLSTACGGCVIEAKRLVRNYVNKFGRQSTERGNVKVMKVVITSEYESMNLKQLRGLFPNIKATSVKGFIKKINDGKA